MRVTKVVIVDNRPKLRFFVFLHKIEWVNMVLRILNLEGHQNCMIGSKVTMGESAGEGVWLLVLVTGGK